MNAAAIADEHCTAARPCSPSARSPSARSPSVCPAITAAIEAKIETLQAEIAKLEAIVAGQRAELEGERHRANAIALVEPRPRGEFVAGRRPLDRGFEETRLVANVDQLGQHAAGVDAEQLSANSCAERRPA